MAETQNMKPGCDEQDINRIPLQVGALTPEQIASIFNHLPVDLTFVDEGNDVRFFSSGKERIFERTPDVIGRNVMNCHHPDSVQLVFKILEDFRAGTRDVAEFWIQTKPQDPENRFIHIRFFAVRNEQGKFLGTLEVAQDVTEIQKLQGERRLLEEEKDIRDRLTLANLRKPETALPRVHPVTNPFASRCDISVLRWTPG